ncbi:salicylate synthase [Actinomadura sp. SCN-SB]|uniref:salicylate synthase n=1 Tax=Actinomadura sp. SCN-SB TaxID=3373092 RepID=UPI0037513E72
MDGPQSYSRIVVDAPDDPLLAIARLAESGISQTYVVYEDDSVWRFAGGVMAEIIVSPRGVRFRWDGWKRELSWNGRPLQQVAALLDQLRIADWRAYGWAAFELAYAEAGQREWMDDAAPLLHLIVPRVEVVIDAEHARVRSSDPDALQAAVQLVEQPVTSPSYAVEPIEIDDLPQDRYTDAVAAAVHEIRQRELQKVILSRVVPIDRDVDLVGTYVVGRRRNSPARSFLLNMGGLQAAGFSPETVVEVASDGQVTTQPLAGTRALGGDAEENTRLRGELLADSKELFEHAISVKVAYDELAGLCRPDTVAVREFMDVKRRGTVQHLGSQVAGQLSADCGPWDAFGAVFPSVTASGVPKHAAYASIRRHEPEPRGLYSGAVFTIDSNGAMDAALVLRTIFREAGRTWLRAGAGIVEQSRPERELQETCEKLRSVAQCLVPAAPVTGPVTGEVDRPQAACPRSSDADSVPTPAKAWQ